MSTTQLRDEGGSYEIPPPATIRTRACKILSFQELLDLRPAPFLVQDVLRRGELIALYAAPSAGKTFVAIDLALCIVTGREWQGHRTRCGSVLYVAAEGASGLGVRARAWVQEYPEGLAALQASFHVLPEAVSILDDAVFERLVEAINDLAERPVLIVIDTLARVMEGGDENKANDMGRFIARCDALRSLIGSAVLVVHHTTRGSKLERGSSALRGACDVMFLLERECQSGGLVFQGTKAKDSELLPRHYLELQRVECGSDDEGGVLSSMVVRRRDGSGPVAKPASVRDSGRVIREALAGAPDQELAAKELRSATTLPPSTYHRTLNAEVGEGRIERRGKKSERRYRLTKLAPEHAAGPSPSPTESRMPSGTNPGSGHGSSSPSPTTPPMGWDLEQEPATPCEHVGDQNGGRKKRSKRQPSRKRDQEADVTKVNQTKAGLDLGQPAEGGHHHA